MYRFGSTIITVSTVSQLLTCTGAERSDIRSQLHQTITQSLTLAVTLFVLEEEGVVVQVSLEGSGVVILQRETDRQQGEDGWGWVMRILGSRTTWTELMKGHRMVLLY
jgi:hypothetical protein